MKPTTRTHARTHAIAVSILTIVAAIVCPTPFVKVAKAEPVLAVGGDTVSVQAERLEVDVLAGEAVLTGKVTVTKGELTVSCPRVDLRFNHTPQVTWVRGSGGVSADVRGVHAEAPTVEMDLSKQILDLRGGVKLTRGQGWLTADSARIEVSTGKVTLTQVKGSIPSPKGGP